ncbi:hypothetical protein C6I20_14450 [Aeromicrobium sp. A1-2]|uniref:hypothetical protein n=1 Tax=Aeromicrobium sp. A1-2 TaxID=2107713 RepID=UPI000E524666|nr:hypothetical protein [Aeromicrobium sp. A1-2]AXT86263.1 hypothetical protein C6I20_14450 [Aeromicrobium sp. A1-2]
MGSQEIVSSAFTKALSVQAPLARKNVDRLRRVNPTDTPADLVRRVTKFYLVGVTSSGGAAGGGAIVPGWGLATAGLDLVAFTEASVLYALTLAEIHGLHPDDMERRRLLVQTVLLGDSAIAVLNKGAERTVPYWGKSIVNKIPMTTVNAANKVLGPRFVTKYGTKQGVLVLSKQVPLGISVVIGASANHVVGRMTVKSAKKVFGPAPVEWLDIS